MAEQAKIMTLHDHDTGEAIAPRTVIEAISGEGKRWNYVGFTEDDQVGVIEGTWPCNRNLLDDWYFVNPVNQRGEHEYTTHLAYTIDRWKWSGIGGNPLSLIVNDGYISVKGTWLAQPIKDSDVPLGTYTISVLTREGVLFSATKTFTSEKYDIFAASSPDTNIQISVIRHWDSNLNYSVFLLGTADDQYADVVAVKFEPGPTQTLAHKEGDTWVLNEVPDYATELAKCQRYQLLISTNSEFIGRTYGSDATKVSGFIPTPVTMRAIPTISLLDNTTITCWNGSRQAASSHTVLGFANNGVAISLTLPSDTFGTSCPVVIDISDSMLLDANL